MTDFDPAVYGPAFSPLLREERLPEIGPGTPNTAAKAQLDQLSLKTAFAGKTIRDLDMAQACLAGIWLYHDFLDVSHGISQTIQTPTGSFWHGIMHRREPDYANSKHWFTKVGAHPTYPAIHREAVELALKDDRPHAASFVDDDGNWSPFYFVDLCELAAKGGAECETLCRQVQHSEWRILFDWCYRQAVAP